MCHFNSLASARLRSPAEFLLLGRCPELALFLEMVALLKLLLSGVTAENGVAVLVDAVAEVLTGHANARLPSSPVGLDRRKRPIPQWISVAVRMH